MKKKLSKKEIQKKNHPQKDTILTTEPIRDVEDIKNIKKHLSDHSRNLCIFTLGINCGLRASDLLNLKVKQVKGLKSGDSFKIRERKTKKKKEITLNKACCKSIEHLLESEDFKMNDFLFKSQRGKVLTVPSLSRLVKSWCKAIGIQDNKGNFASHTLRKTFGYHGRITFGRGLPEMVKVFNHASQKQTLTYLGIEDEEIKSIYLDEL